MTTKLLNDLILSSTKLYIPPQQHQEPTMRSLTLTLTQRSLTGRKSTDWLLLLQSLKRRWNPSIPVNPSMPKKDPRLAGDPLRRGPALRNLSGPPSSWGSPRGEAQSAAALLRLQGCLQSLKPFPPEGGRASRNGILWLIYIKSSFIFILFMALVHTRTAWMWSASPWHLSPWAPLHC